MGMARADGDGEQDQAPDDGGEAGQAQRTGFGRAGAAGMKEIHHGGGGERIERAAQVGHGGGQDGGDQQTGQAGRERTPDEGGINAIGLNRRGDVKIAVVHIEEHADQQEQGELDADDGPTGQQGGAALALIAGAEEALHHELVGAVAGGGEETAAGQAGPERVGAGEKLHGGRKTEIENGELVGGRRDGHHVSPSAGDLSEDDEKAENCSDYIERHLHDVGPDDRGHAAFEGIEEGENHDHHNRSDLAGAEHDGDDDGDGEDADAFGESAGDQENGGGELADAFAEAAAHELVGSEHFAAEILGKEQDGDHDAGQQVAEDHLEEAEVAVEGEGGGADDGQGAGFGGDYGKADGPPRGGAPAQEIVAEALLAGAKTGAEPGDGGQVGENDGQVETVHAKGSLQDSVICYDL